VSRAMTVVTVVTGANSGIGRATAVHLASKGHVVYGTARNLDSTGKLRAMAEAAGVEVQVVQMDVADDESVATGFAKIIGEAGRIDVLVNNAGVGGNAVVEDCTPEQIQDVMNVNVSGALRCIRAVLPTMRAQGSGAIVNITSVTGRVGAIAQAPYVASKWALEGLSEQLALEVAPFGVRVVIVEPGITKSAIFAKNVDLPPTNGAYEAHYRRMLQFYAAGIPQATDPSEVGAVIHDAVTTDRPKLRYACSWGGQEMAGNRSALSDETWVDIGRATDDDDYYRRFEAAFGLAIAPTASPAG
jgi:NAD(P)-dependent dehydrogenase (short-subunit alcohol dehydrogenase family)